MILELSDGSQAEVDILIAADGVHSRVREIMLGPETPRFTGKVAYRTTFPAKLLGGHDIGPSRTKWWGPDRHIVIYYITRNSDEVYFVTSQPEKAEWMTKESWSAKGELSELRELVQGFSSRGEGGPGGVPRRAPLGALERDALPRWVDGHVALLGDACHPMTPYMAQGAASALEDFSHPFALPEGRDNGYG